MDRKRHKMQQNKDEEFQQMKFHPILVYAPISFKKNKEKTCHMSKYIEKYEQVEVEFFNSKIWKMKFHQSWCHMSENIASNQ